jgi:tetratricopeptide (TPR) repeat protein
VQRKTQLGVYLLLILLFGVFASSLYWGCAGTSSKQEISPERRKAIQDSLFNIHKREVARLFSFGYEPYKQGDFEKAKRYFIQVHTIDTTGIYSQNLYRYLGRAFLALNVPDSAEWAFKTGLEKNPEDLDGHRTLGYLYRAQSRFQAAIEQYEILAENEPDSTNHFRRLGELYVLNDDPDKAIQAFQTVISQDPTDIKSQERLDNLLAQTGDVDAVIAQRESMVEQFPDDMEKRLDLAMSYRNIGEFEKAIEQLEIVIGKEPENVRALEFLGDSYQQVEHFSDAVTIYNKIIQLNPQDKKNHCNLALAYNAMGRYSTARRQVARALAIDSQYGLAFLTRGIIYETAADNCVDKQKDKQPTFDDKLVYKMAYDEYEKAKRDLEWKRDAERRMRYLENMIPTRSDYFMHKNQDSPKSECYNWI